MSEPTWELEDWALIASPPDCLNDWVLAWEN